MYKSLGFVFLLTACQNTTLSVKPLTTYTPDLELAGPLTYLQPSLSTDPFINNTNIIRVNGYVGEFKLVIQNLGQQHLRYIGLAVVVNNADKISVASPARIYHEVFWGGGLFSFDTPVQFPNGSNF